MVPFSGDMLIFRGVIRATLYLSQNPARTGTFDFESLVFVEFFSRPIEKVGTDLDPPNKHGMFENGWDILCM